MSFWLKNINKLIRKIGYELQPSGLVNEALFVRRIPYAGEDETRIMQLCKPYTQTTPETLFSLIRAIKYICDNGIKGAFVECGVWRGGSVMAMAMVLDSCDQARDIFLFDTFEGMPSGEQCDVDLDGNDEDWYRKESDKYVHAGKGDKWNAVAIEEVESNLSRVQPTKQNFHFVKGKVEDTIPSQAPWEIALLRLDTDFYSSTKHELDHLFPRLVKGGILIIDDYGHFLGARKAVDEYFKSNNIKMLMNRVDYTVIMGVKL